MVSVKTKCEVPAKTKCDVVTSVTRNPKRSVRGRAMDGFVLRWFIEGENNLKRG
jgi:hypothetical protein